MNGNDNLSSLSDLEPGRSAIEDQEEAAAIAGFERRDRERWGKYPPPDADTWRRMPWYVKQQILMIARVGVFKNCIRRVLSGV
jgi:hypothetical protein